MSPATGSARVVESLGWAAATRDDAAVAEALLEGSDLDGLYGLGHATLVDMFFCWLREIGVLDLLGRLQGMGLKRLMIPFDTFVLLYFLRCLARIPSQNALPDLLFADEVLMRRLGFNAHQLQFGLCKRGEHQRHRPRHNLPLDPEALTKNILKLDVGPLQALVTEVLRRLWAQVPEIPSPLLVAIDGTLMEVGPTAKEATVTSRSRQVLTREGLKSVPEVHIGFKLIWAYAPQVGLPLGLAVDGAHADERPFVNGLLDQAEAVLDGRAQIDGLLIDRGYLSGPGLWEIRERGLVFVIPAKRNEQVYSEARSTASMAHPGLMVHRQSRTETVPVRPKKGGPATMRRRVTEVVGVEGCQTFETYAPAEKVRDGQHKDKFKKSFEPNPINAVVLTRQDGRDPPDLVLLTNGPVTEPLAVLDAYDQRSRIENQGNRTLKQDWCLERPPQRSRKGVEIHSRFVLLAFALTQGYRLWEEAQVKAEDAGQSSTLGQYVRRLERANRDRVIVFVEEHYGLFYTSELAFLLGRRVKEPNPRGAQSLEELLARLGITQPRAPP